MKKDLLFDRQGIAPLYHQNPDIAYIDHLRICGVRKSAKTQRHIPEGKRLSVYQGVEHYANRERQFNPFLMCLIPQNGHNERVRPAKEKRVFLLIALGTFLDLMSTMLKMDNKQYTIVLVHIAKFRCTKFLIIGILDIEYKLM